MVAFHNDILLRRLVNSCREFESLLNVDFASRYVSLQPLPFPPQTSCERSQTTAFHRAQACPQADYRRLSMASVASVIRLLGLSVVTFLISRRLYNFISSKPEWRKMSWGKICMFLILITSWAFLFTCGFLLAVVDSSTDSAACSVAMFACAILHGVNRVRGQNFMQLALCDADSQLLIHAFLVEKVYIVWSNGCMIARLRTPMYKVCLVVQLGFTILLGLLITGISMTVGGNGACLVEYDGYLATSIVGYDFLQCLFFTLAFVWPLKKSSVMSPALKTIAKKTLVGAFSGLTIYVASALVALISSKGHEWDSEYMSFFSVDVTLNALILYWVSSGAPSDSVRDFTLPQVTITAGSNWEVDSIRTDSSQMTVVGVSDGTNDTQALSPVVGDHGTVITSLARRTDTSELKSNSNDLHMELETDRNPSV
ncbi:hypothetical protein E1B28_010860 [Marasmius oreades]|uniref:Transmembrane protein n=1 Tax=Marasmius oreades TaxID=181124 RepID=A0A9P7RSW7_9AGAR|nr:uncharacterized protein E1B28_010860 [Marasmius oreades]KAG7089154.1 hypothetical protein E1B28_010860 [Marasmius oreades]